MMSGQLQDQPNLEVEKKCLNLEPPPPQKKNNLSFILLFDILLWCVSWNKNL